MALKTHYSGYLWSVNAVMVLYDLAQGDTKAVYSEIKNIRANMAGRILYLISSLKKKNKT